LVTGSAPKKFSLPYLSACVIVRDEDEYIEEWIAFHLAVGIERFLVIDNSDSSSLSTILSAYVRSGVVELRKFSSRFKPQIGAYNRALEFLRGKSKWVAFIDVDEFLFPSQEDNLAEVLRQFEEFPGLAVNWVCFGNNGHRKKPTGWVIENFTSRGPLEHVVEIPHLRMNSELPTAKAYRPMNSHVKCIVDPSRAQFFRTAHHLSFRDDTAAATETFDPIEGPFSEYVSIEKVRINHYWSKSEEELKDKVRKGRVSQIRKGETSPYSWELASRRMLAATGCQDTTALRFLENAKANYAWAQANRVSNPPKVRRLRYSVLGGFKYLLRTTLIGLRKNQRKISALTRRWAVKRLEIPS